MSNLKDFYNEKSIFSMAESIHKSYPAFKTKDFLNEVLPPLKKKEMKDRVRWISKTLHTYLPSKFPDAAKILVASIKSEDNPQGISGFLAWPFTQFVEDFGLDHLQISMDSLKAITQVMSAEFAIRPFLIGQEKESLKLLQKWVRDKNVHVRRLVSEGTRPRLPWGQRLYSFQKNPQICISFLRTLRNDPEIYVRKSVANHLNDISKDHPEFLIKELSAWIKDEPQNERVQWIIKHSLRSLIKDGHKGALALLGFRGAQISSAKIHLSPSNLRFGDSLKIQFSATGKSKESWLIDYVIHHKKANGTLKPKVFKWTTKSLKKGEKISLHKNHAFRKISTRKYYPGKHIVEIQVNGKSVGKKEFTLLIP